jgi:DNA polymerase I-like protein with 3'-5' exonuclease and polymerase domains
VTVIGGMKTDRDGRVRTTFGHNPSSLRLCSFDPNLQNIPRGGDGYSQYVKDIFVAPEGYVFWERDFSAIEAVLVGYFAGSPDYIRFAKLGVHDFLASHMLQRPADLRWGDDALKGYFREIKRNHKKVRDNAKRVIHGSNYMMTPKRMHELFPESFPTIKDATKLQGLYFDLFPAIRKWHRSICQSVDGTKRKSSKDVDGSIDPWTLGVAYARNPFGYVHHFYNVLDWRRVDIADGTHIWDWSFGEDAKRLVSFLPQSTAAAIIKSAAKRLYYECGEPVNISLRLLIHDSILGESQEEEVEECLRVSEQVMEAPIPELPLDPAWEMGEYLTIGTEAKVGKSWGEM